MEEENEGKSESVEEKEGKSKFVRPQSGSRFESRFDQLLHEHGLFLVNFIAMLDRHPDVKRQMREDMRQIQWAAALRGRPHLESRTFKAHTMDNVMVRRMCDEMLSLENPAWLSYSKDPNVKDKSNYFRTLRASRGTLIHAIRLMNNPEVKIGGYFIMSAGL